MRKCSKVMERIKKLCREFDTNTNSNPSEVLVLHSKADTKKDIVVATTSLFAAKLFGCLGRMHSPISRDSGNRKKKLRPILFRRLTPNKKQSFTMWLSRTTMFSVETS